jgi:FKBP-type peptidyl-prolyl cis-trans isomerase SlyD
MKAQIVSFHCVLKNKLGQVLSVSSNKDVLTHESTSESCLKGLSRGLIDIQKGERRRIFVPAEEAYGFYQLDQITQVPLDEFSIHPRVGEMVRLSADAKPLRVTEIRNAMVTLDGNHPLAGQDLIFEVEAISARDASMEELLESGGEESAGPLFH